MHPAGAMLDEHQDMQSPEEHGVHVRPAGLTVTDLGIVIGTYEPAGPVRHGQM
jgi:hypothetical protein